MFVITINRKKMVKMALAVCIVAVGAVAIGVKGFFTQESETAIIGKKTVKLSTTQDMIDYISEKGFTADIQSAKVNEVEIPKKFDDSFNTFNEKIKQNDGLSLDKYKGDKVNKWTFDLLNYGEVKASAVLLIKKEKLIGAYILEAPDGIAKAMVKTQMESETDGLK